MNAPAVGVDFDVQQAALLKAVVRDVLVLVRDHRPARQQRVAVFAVFGDGVGAVHRLIAFRRKELGLGQLGPALEVRGLASVQLAHFLQAHDVGIELLHRQPKVVDLKPPHRTDTLHALVDVVGSHPQNVVVLHGPRNGS